MTTPAGWYPQPDGTQRYWDGSAWTEHTAPGAALATPPAPPGPPVAAPPVAVEPPASAPIPAPPAPVAAAPQAFAAVPPAPSSSYAAMPGEVSAAGAAAPKKRRVWPWVLGIGGGLVVLGIIAVVAVVMLVGKATSGPKSAADSFNTAYFSGDCKGYLDVTTADFRSVDGYPGTCDEATAAAYFPDLKAGQFSISLDGVETNGSTATVTGNVTSTSMANGPLTYHLVKVDGKWLVDSIE